MTVTYTTKQSARVGIAAVRTAVLAGFYDDDPCEESVARG